MSTSAGDSTLDREPDRDHNSSSEEDIWLNLEGTKQAQEPEPKTGLGTPGAVGQQSPPYYHSYPEMQQPLLSRRPENGQFTPSEAIAYRQERPPLQGGARQSQYPYPQQQQHHQQQQYPAQAGGAYDFAYSPPAPKDKNARTPLNAGSFIGVTGIILVLLALVLPWYVISVDIETGNFTTNGQQDILVITAFEGVRFDPPMNSTGGNSSAAGDIPTGIIPYSFLPFLPLTLFYAITAVIALIRLLVSRKGKKRARRLIRGGIVRYMPIIVMLIIISQLPYFADRFVGEESVPPVIDDILNQIARQPLGGESGVDLDEWGRASLFWALGSGGWLLLLGPTLEWLGGIVDRAIGKRYKRSHHAYS